MKVGIDILLVRRGFFPSREKARAAVMEGIVFQNQERIEKPGTKVEEKAVITVRQSACPYVSRGGLKLEKAMQCFPVHLRNSICADMGASTGGFTDCMLQNGAVKVYAIDVGYGQLDYRLRTDPRVICMERTNIRYLDPDVIPDPIDFISIDVSFISLRLILPSAAAILRPGGSIVALVKPQFEAGREQVGKKGIVRDPAVHRDVLHRVMGYAEEYALYPAGVTFSPVTGAKGNIEYLLFLQDTPSEIDQETLAGQAVLQAHNALKH